MKLKNFYIKGVHGKDLKKLEDALSVLPENFVSLGKERKFSLDVKSEGEKNDKYFVTISVHTMFPEKFKLNLSSNFNDIKDGSCNPDLNWYSFNFKNVHYEVMNTYDAFTS